MLLYAYAKSEMAEMPVSKTASCNASGTYKSVRRVANASVSWSGTDMVTKGGAEQRVELELEPAVQSLNHAGPKGRGATEPGAESSHLRQAQESKKGATCN